MPNILKLVRGATELALNSGGDGFSLRNWVPKLADPLGEDGPQLEGLKLRLKSDTQDHAAAKLQELSAMQAYARRWRADFDETTPVWLHVRQTNQSGEQRALVQALESVFSTSWFGAPAEQSYQELQLALTRAPYWESLTLTTQKQTASVPVVAGLYDYTASPASDVPGDVPARLNTLEFWQDGLAGDGLSEMWIAFHSVNRHGSLASYNPYWNLKDSTTLGTDTATTADAAAKSGTRVTITFATQAPMAGRCLYKFDPSGGVSGEPRGPHLALLRAAVPDTVSQTKVQLCLYEQSPEQDGIFTEAVSVPLNAAYDFFPLGIVNFEPTLKCYLYAGRDSGSGSLYVDGIAFLPLDEYFLHAGPGDVDLAANLCRANEAERFQLSAPHSDGNLIGYNYYRTYTLYQLDHLGAGVPPGDGRLVFCGRDTLYHAALGLTVTLRLDAYPRYQALRGAG